MDTRVALLEMLYQHMRRDRLKLESRQFGFDFIEQLTADGAVLDYGQVDSHLVHKYRLLQLSEVAWNRFITGHVNQEYNICLYFDERENSAFCLNLDNNYKSSNTAPIPELDLAVLYLRQHFGEYGMEPLVLKSGRGYHLWCRLQAPAANAALYGFMVRIVAKTMASLHMSGHDYHAVKFNMGPNPRVIDTVSLRAFGSIHARTGMFSQVVTEGETLGEQASWACLARYVGEKEISSQQFANACRIVKKEIPL